MPQCGPDEAERTLALLKHVRQARQFDGRPISPDAVNELLEVARWTGSALNRQPWHFIVFNRPEQLQQIADLSPRIAWVAGASLAIGVVLDNRNPHTERHDEGRITERLLIAANALGFGGGTAWFDTPDQQGAARAMFGVPDDHLLKSVIAFGYPTTYADPRSGPAKAGRKPLSELVGYGRYPGHDEG